MLFRLLLLLAAPVLSLAQQCNFVVSPTALSLPATGAAQLSPTLTVQATGGICGWTALSNVPWINISFGQSGTNNGTVGILVQRNLEAVSRSGSLTIAGQTISVSQAASNCAFTLNPQSKTASSAGESGSFQVITTCDWQAVTNTDWIDVTSPPAGRGSGSGIVAYVVKTNSGATRSGTIQVGPLRFTVQQAGGSCSQTLSLTQVNILATGGNGTVQVTSPCAWTAAANATWISITGGQSADRDGTLAYSVQANPSAQPRTGTIRIGNQAFTINQAGTGCAVTLTPSIVNLAAAGGNGTIVVSAPCAWTATSNQPWITATAGTVTVDYVVSANTDVSSRSGTITIGTQIFTINQAGNTCAITLSPASAQVGVAGGGGNFLVSAPSGCQWSVTNPAEWVLLNAESGDGTGAVVYSVMANPGPPRTAAIRINAQTFSIEQAGVAPSFTAAGVANAASFGNGPLAPGLIFTIFGSGLGPSQLATPTIDPAAPRFPFELAGIRVLFDDVAAPLLYVSSSQLSGVVPFGIAGRPTVRLEVEAGGVRSQTVFMPVASATPAIFTQDASGEGPGAILNQDFTLNSPENPAEPGSFVSLFATGGGLVEPATEDGRLPSGPSAVATRVSAEVNGEAAEVTYAGGAPGLVAGVLQVNLRVPANSPPGALSILIRSGEIASQSRVTVSVK